MVRPEVAGVYVLLGVAAALWLRRQGRPVGTAVAAIVAWPLLLALLPDRAPDVHGPFAERIEAVFGSTLTLLREAADPGVHELTSLRDALVQADRRLAHVDAIVRAAAGAPQDRVAALEAARGRVGAEVEAVLEEVIGMRVAMGWVALAPPGQRSALPIGGQLAQLRDRMLAMEELAALQVP